MSITPKFLDPLRLEEVTDCRWRLMHELRYDSAVARERIIVPVGFETDLCSVPRAPLAFLLAGDTARKAAVIHDFIYQTHVNGRALADSVFLEAMEAEGVPRWRRALMYLGVRGLGAWHW